MPRPSFSRQQHKEVASKTREELLSNPVVLQGDSSSNPGDGSNLRQQGDHPVLGAHHSREYATASNMMMY